MNREERLDVETLLVRLEQINEEQQPEHWLWDRVVTCDIPRLRERSVSCAAHASIYSSRGLTAAPSVTATPTTAPSGQGRSVMTHRTELLQEAERVVSSDRNNSYGEPEDNLGRIAELWTVQFEALLAPGKKFTAADVALAQIQVKMARLTHRVKRDSLVDVAGYAACAWECSAKGDLS